MSDMKLDKLEINTPIGELETLDPVDRDFISDFSDEAILGLQEINPFEVLPKDEKLAAKAEKAVLEMRAGDIHTAGTLAEEVLQVQPNNPFMHRVVINATALRASTTCDERIEMRFQIIDLLNRLYVDPTLRPETVSPIKDAAIKYELARHHYNLGNDLFDRALETGNREDYARSAQYFRTARSYVSKREFPVSYMARLLRQAVAEQALGNSFEVIELVTQSLSLDQKFTLTYLHRHEDYAPTLNIAKQLINQTGN